VYAPRFACYADVMNSQPHTDVFEFVQAVQAIALLFLEANLTRLLPSVWDVLLRAPRCHSDDERAVLAIVIRRLADALFDGQPCEILIADRVARGSFWNPHAASALDYLFRNFSNSNFRLRAVAAHCRVSVTYLSRLVRLTTGYGLHSHLRGVRVLFAARLLADVGLSIKQVAARAGYKTTAALDHQFRAHLFMTPTEFRRWTC